MCCMQPLCMQADLGLEGDRETLALEKRAMDDPDLHYKIRTDSVEVIASRFHPKMAKILTDKKWRAAFDKQGRLDISKVLIRIQGGGVHPSIREEVWEFLLGCFAADSTYVERAALRKSRREKYSRMKADCQALDPAVGSGTVVTLPRINENGTVINNRHQIDRDGNEPSFKSDGLKGREVLPRSLLSLLRQDESSGDGSATLVLRDVEDNKAADTYFHKLHEPQLNRSSAIQVERPLKNEEVNRAASGNSAQDSKVIEWRLTLHQIGLDVVRTDRTLEFYEKPSNLAKLWDILAVYSWLDPDIGYCQGMSDLCSPMVILFQNEGDAFWCFERLMHRLRENFRCTEQAVGVQKQLANLGLVLRVVDPKLHKHLDDLGGGSYIFAFRMLMVLFRREFSFSDSLFLWEIMWSLEFDPNLGLHDVASFQQQKTVHVSKQAIKNGWIIRRGKSLYRWGKFERQNIKYGQGESHDIPFVVFCAASIFESQKIRLQESVGLDEVLKLLNEITGKLDAKKACKEALRIHKKYLLKAASQGQ